MLFPVCKFHHLQRVVLENDILDIPDIIGKKNGDFLEILLHLLSRNLTNGK